MLKIDDTKWGQIKRNIFNNNFFVFEFKLVCIEDLTNMSLQYKPWALFVCLFDLNLQFSMQSLYNIDLQTNPQEDPCYT